MLSPAQDSAHWPERHPPAVLAGVQWPQSRRRAGAPDTLCSVLQVCRVRCGDMIQPSALPQRYNVAHIQF